MENQKGCSDMTEKSRTMVFQIPEELFQRIKRHLERETLCTGRKLTQREFVLNLITKALDEAEGEDGSAKGSPHSPLSHPVWAKQTLRTHGHHLRRKRRVSPQRPKLKTTESHMEKGAQGVRHSSDALGGFLRFIREINY